MKFFSLQALVRTLSLSLALVVGLSVLGCDSNELNKRPDRWVGNWKQTDGENNFEGNAIFALSLSRDEVKTTERAGCTTRTMEVTNVEVEEEGSSGSPNLANITLGNGDVYELRVRPNGESLVVNFSDDRREVYASADDSKTTEEIVVGCP